MKTIIFILLKIAEIIAIPITYLILCYAGFYFHNYILANIFDLKTFPMINDNDFYWIAPLIFIFYCAIIGFIILIVWSIIYFWPDWIELNKSWANKIYNKIKK